MSSERPRHADDSALVEALKQGDPVALADWYDRFAPDVLRVLSRILGPDLDLADIHHDVFVRALSSIRTLNDPSALRPWLISVAVHTARTAILRRNRGRWLRFLSFGLVPDMPAPVATRESVEAVRDVYRVLRALPTDDRVVFALRFIDGMELQEIADACGVSLATAKRRVARARDRFWTRARRYPALAEWLDEEVRDGDS
ncbi:MAG: sigma-70 family RNA polymerase sigma factor [Deltaproteobacteria bacterium]|nr:sigma-70 family RNA polymerase sigma factor [Deltaproteobacteria bacterium]